MQGKVILLTGAPATGKTTLAKGLTDRMAPLQRVSFGQLLFEHKRKTHPELTYEEMRANSSELITPEDVAMLDALLVERVKERRVETNLIIDSHAVTRETYGFRVTAFCYNLLAELKLDAVIALHCEPDKIMRRMGQSSEGRIQVSIEEIRHHMQIQESLATLYGVLCGCPVFILDSSYSSHDLVGVTVGILLGLGVDTQQK